MNKNIPIDIGVEKASQVAKWVIHTAEAHFDKYPVPVRGVGQVNVARHFADKMMASRTDNAWKWHQRYARACKAPGKDAIPFKALLAVVAVAYSLAALREENEPLPNRAWEFASKAAWYFGLFGGDQDRVDIEAARRTQLAKFASERRHGRPGASRDKQGLIRSAWASGKYVSRDVCAEQECAALEMSFSTARKALRNTPEPERK